MGCCDSKHEENKKQSQSQSDQNQCVAYISKSQLHEIFGNNKGPESQKSLRNDEELMKELIKEFESGIDLELLLKLKRQQDKQKDLQDDSKNKVDLQKSKLNKFGSTGASPFSSTNEASLEKEDKGIQTDKKDDNLIIKVVFQPMIDLKKDEEGILIMQNYEQEKKQLMVSKQRKSLSQTRREERSLNLSTPNQNFSILHSGTTNPTTKHQLIMIDSFTSQSSNSSNQRKNDIRYQSHAVNLRGNNALPQFKEQRTDQSQQSLFYQKRNNSNERLLNYKSGNIQVLSPPHHQQHEPLIGQNYRLNRVEVRPDYRIQTQPRSNEQQQQEQLHQQQQIELNNHLHMIHNSERNLNNAYYNYMFKEPFVVQNAQSNYRQKRKSQAHLFQYVANTHPNYNTYPYPYSIGGQRANSLDKSNYSLNDGQ